MMDILLININILFWHNILITSLCAEPPMKNVFSILGYKNPELWIPPLPLFVLNKLFGRYHKIIKSCLKNCFQGLIDYWNGCVSIQCKVNWTNIRTINVFGENYR